MKVFLTAILAASAMTFSLASGADDSIRIALAGDSTVKTYTKEGDPTRGWGQTIGSFFKDNVKFENHAEGGRSTKTFINENRWKKILDSKPDYVFVQFGHNDSHAKDKPESTDAATDYKEYLRQYADDALKAGIKVIFITPMHRRSFRNGKVTEELLPYANAMKEVAKEKNILLIDLYSSSGKLLEEKGEEPATDLFCSVKDRTHFSQKGAEEMARLIVEDLKKTDSPLKNYIK